jgi:hypothetical protein
MTLLTMLLVWFLGLAVFVVLKARRPKWDYPAPPTGEVAAEKLSDAA